ncbi:MAG: 6-pyruvoyl tetrahydropterin synthase family protein [Phycisphaerae bacterium]|nr:6-pyruvoyl tetrahydropterin synthase family protein [Phycisphaerae bacterium]
MKNINHKFGIQVEHQFDASHYITLPDGTVEPQHNHCWKVQVTVETNELDNHGLVIDFIQLKGWVKAITDEFEACRSINNHPDFADIAATTENFAFVIHSRLSDLLPARVKLTRVQLWEAKGCQGYYET